MNKYDKNLDSWVNYVLPAISLIGFMVITCIVVYNCINTGIGIGSTYVSGW